MRRLWRATILAVLVGTLAGVTAPTRAADTFSFTTIDVPGATDTYALSINNAGQIAGYYVAGKAHGFLRNSDRRFHDH